MARTVADAAILLGAMAGVDPRDRATAASAGKAAPTTRAALKADGLKGARIGVARKKYFGYSPPADALIEAAIAAMKQQGAVIVDPADIPIAPGSSTAASSRCCCYEFKADLNAYLPAKLAPGARIHSLRGADCVQRARAANARCRSSARRLLLQAEKKGPLDIAGVPQGAGDLPNAVARPTGIDAVMTRLRLDAIVAPTGSPAWTTDLLNGDHFLGASSTPAAVAGYPSITVPAGFSHGLPVGITFIGRAWSEATLIQSGVRLRAGDASPQAAAVSRGGADGRRNCGSGFGPGALIRPTAPP